MTQRQTQLCHNPGFSLTPFRFWLTNFSKLSMLTFCWNHFMDCSFVTLCLGPILLFLRFLCEMLNPEIIKDVRIYRWAGAILCRTKKWLLTIPTQWHLMMPLGNKPFENTVGKEEIAPLPTVFSTCLDNFHPFSSNLKLSSANYFSLEV